ncbi:MAG: hypothetical protein SV760_06710 [Halobacteria archaeon]|nr:hypothetical protein [Halobacteria archaeon]
MTLEPLPPELRQKVASHFNQSDSEAPIPAAATFAALATVEAVEDGDTWKGRRKPDPKTIVGPSYYRLVGIDTHETDGENAKKGKKEKKFTEDWVQTGRDDWSKDDWPFIVVFTDEQSEFEGTYGRSLVNLVRRSDGTDLASALKSNFDGVTYDG